MGLARWQKDSEIDTDTNTLQGQMFYITDGISDGLCNAKQRSLGMMGRTNQVSPKRVCHKKNKNSEKKIHSVVW